jgi:hypothetical protein
VLIKRFETQRLPRALALKDKVDGGGRLNDLDMALPAAGRYGCQADCRLFHGVILLIPRSICLCSVINHTATRWLPACTSARAGPPAPDAARAMLPSCVPVTICRETEWICELSGTPPVTATSASGACYRDWGRGAVELY